MTNISLSGSQLIGAESVHGALSSFRAVNPATGLELEPVYGGGSKQDVDRACNLAWAAFDAYRETGNEARAVFLETIADEILALGDTLIERTMAESGLPHGRIEGERGRTVGQLQMFARLVREGSFVEARIDSALPERKPLPRVDIRQRHIALGPVGVFSASNFPLAFSVAGGDTASAMAAGCPVVVKAHSAHPGTSELVGRAIQTAVAKCGLPEGVFSMLFGAGTNVGIALVEHPHIKAIGFNGSRFGGVALMKAAAARSEPIPVYAEMSSINPVFLMPAALRTRAAQIGQEFCSSLTLGAGQFCTNPGLILAVQGNDLEAFLQSAATTLAASSAATMLTPDICRAYRDGVARLAAYANVEQISRGLSPIGPSQGQSALFATDATAFMANPDLANEIFGAVALVIRCPDMAIMRKIGEALEGQLTATVQMDADDIADVRELLPMLERRAGRILINEYPTSVEVNDTMVHGGPFPATSDGRTTSVGTMAIRRFLRPVAYQNFPKDLLPLAIQNKNSAQIWRRMDGVFGRK